MGFAIGNRIVSLLAFSKYWCLLCCFCIGKFYDIVGVKWTALTAGLMVCGGYLFTWLVIEEHLGTTSHWLIAIAFLFIGQGDWGKAGSYKDQCFCLPVIKFATTLMIGLYLSMLVTNMKNFDQQNRGKVRICTNAKLIKCCWLCLFYLDLPR